MSPFTLHVAAIRRRRRDLDRDLRTILNVTNPWPGSQRQGVVALMYQRLVNVAASIGEPRLLERSTNRFAMVATTSVLANTCRRRSAAPGDLGDFCNLIAHAKDSTARSARSMPAGTQLPVRGDLPAERQLSHRQPAEPREHGERRYVGRYILRQWQTPGPRDLVLPTAGGKAGSASGRSVRLWPRRGNAGLASQRSVKDPRRSAGAQRPDDSVRGTSSRRVTSAKCSRQKPEQPWPGPVAAGPRTASSMVTMTKTTNGGHMFTYGGQGRQARSAVRRAPGVLLAPAAAG